MLIFSMYYTIYKTTNLINGKFYIGAHKTEDLNDDYLGSGDMINEAIGKYSQENFKKEILSFHGNEDLMYLEEARIVTSEFIKRRDNYNLTPGGKKPPNRNGKKANKNQRNSARIVGLKNKDRKRTDEFKQNLRNKYKGKTRSKDIGLKISLKLKGHAVSEESKRKNREENKKNTWITNGIITKSIKNYEIIPAGFYPGRTMK